MTSWLAALDVRDRAMFFGELKASIEDARRAGSADPIEKCLRDWRATGEALSDPARRAVLTGDGCGDYVEVPRP